MGALDTLWPRLFVRDVGEISLPLSEVQARGIVEKARHAPFGKGSQTISSIRRDLSLPPSSVTPHLYKMLLYETGTMFKPHTDTEKIPGMFSTLVISLPSRHTGGDVVVKHCGTKMYSDVVREILSVISGYRWVLTCNLALPEVGLPLAGGPMHQVQGLRDALSNWISSSDRRPLYYALDHKYTEAFISLKRMKTKNARILQRLHQLSSELSVDVLFAFVEKHESGSCEPNYGGYFGDGRDYYDDDEDGYYDDQDGEKGLHILDEVFKTENEVRSLMDLDGCVVARHLPLDKDALLQDDFFDDEVDEEDYEGFLGNSMSAAPAIRHVLANALAHTPSKEVGFNDGRVIVDVTLQVHQFGYYFKTNVTPLLEQQAAKIGFALDALSRMHKSEMHHVEARELWVKLAADKI
ncbi:hypothetical protein GQ53DRAFT_831070 [Thozetella sp. PMI_491]|nr:hypothetical protein GQ53DRAFT_831070 [Thozetella sp. PMI_491]